MAILTALVSFTGSNGSLPSGGLIVDPNGNLFGTTEEGGSSNNGSLFEIAKTTTGYGSAPTILVSFDGIAASSPNGGLIADASGDLFGTTSDGGPNGAGTVYELVKTASGYANTPTVLVSFDRTDGFAPLGGLIADANGDLFGTTVNGGSSDAGTVFEIVKAAEVYASTPTVLVSFDVNNEQHPYSGLLADADGNLLGTTKFGGANGDGTVFEIARTANGYASTPAVLFSFAGMNGANPEQTLIADASGNLFGTTDRGGANNDGTVFEIAKTADGYSSAPTVLVSFNGTNGSFPAGGLVVDSNGNLFGGTNQGAGDGVYEIANTAGGYASTPTVLAGFDGTNGDGADSLIADASGNLFGVAGAGGANDEGTVFELTGSGYQVACYCRGTLIRTEHGEKPVEMLAIGDLVATASGAVRAVRWIGRRSYAGRFLAANPGVQPIRFQAGCLGNGLPRRDLLVSPKHAMFLDSLLIPAHCLVNGTTIMQRRGLDRVDYFHIELDTHDVLLAEGAPSESFMDDDSRAIFHNAGDFAAMYPDGPGSRRFCAPRVEHGYELEVIRQRLVTLAGETALVA